MPKSKEKKIIDRLLAHQLIAIENPSNHVIEEIRFKDKSKPGIEDGSGLAVLSAAANPSISNYPHIIKPSSLNYKISLIEAARNFFEKDKNGAEQVFEVEIEEPSSKKLLQYEVFDDALFNLQFFPKEKKVIDKK